MDTVLPAPPYARITLTAPIVTAIRDGLSTYAATDISTSQRLQMRSIRGELAGQILEVPVDTTSTRLGVLLNCLLPQVLDASHTGDSEAAALTLLAELTTAMYRPPTQIGAQL